MKLAGRVGFGEVLIGAPCAYLTGISLVRLTSLFLPVWDPEAGLPTALTDRISVTPTRLSASILARKFSADGGTVKLSGAVCSLLEKEEAEERDEMSRGLGWLAIIATASPLLGLLGTVLGVMNSFLGVAAAGSSSITVVAPGVAEALVATAGGLVVAIPAAMAYNYLTARLNRFTGELEGISSELIGALAREGRI